MQLEHNILSMRMILALYLAAALPLLAQHEGEKKDEKKNPFIGDLKAIEAGRALFANGCAACHGAEGQGGRGPNLREHVYWHPVDDETLYRAVKNGNPAGGMPAANLPEDETWQVVAFVRSLTSPAIENKTPGDPKAGEELFWGKANCGGCHAVQGRGGRLGPDLSNIGGARALPQLHQAILDPDAEISPGYQGAQVLLKGGKTLRGVARNRTNYSLQLQSSDGRLHLLSMNDVSQITLMKTSLMPKDYSKRFSSQEIENLVAYLSRQSVRPVEQAKAKEK
jgi:cytochrome c oxidase cbb3-type subunit III